MSSLLASLLPESLGDSADESSQHALPLAIRERAQNELRSNGFPQLKTEAWKYTSLRRLETWKIVPQTVNVSAVKARVEAYFGGAIPRHCLVFAAGQLQIDLSHTEGIKLQSGASLHAAAEQLLNRQQRAEDAFVRLCLAQAAQVWSVSVEQPLSEPLHIVHLSANPTQEALESNGPVAKENSIQQLYLHFSVSAAQQLSCIEHFIHDHAGLSNYCFQLNLAEGARFEHGRRVNNAPNAVQVIRTDVELAKGAQYQLAEAVSSGMMTRHEARVNFAGDRGQASLRSAARLSGRSRLDQDWWMNHAANNCTTEQVFRAAVDDQAAASFTGRASIQEHIKGSEVHQSSRGLMLSGDAEVNARPVLEIYADEVQASHGATVGCLDESAWHYLRARGIPSEIARDMLIESFVLSAFDGFDQQQIKESLAAQVGSLEQHEYE